MRDRHGNAYQPLWLHVDRRTGAVTSPCQVSPARQLRKRLNLSGRQFVRFRREQRRLAKANA